MAEQAKESSINVDTLPPVSKHLALIEQTKRTVSELPDQIKALKREIAEARQERARAAALESRVLPVGRPEKTALESQRDALDDALSAAKLSLAALVEALPEVRRRAQVRLDTEAEYSGKVLSANTAAKKLLEALNETMAVVKTRSTLLDEIDALARKLGVAPDRPRLCLFGGARFRDGELYEVGGLVRLATDIVRQELDGSAIPDPNPFDRTPTRDPVMYPPQESEASYLAKLLEAERQFADEFSVKCARNEFNAFRQYPDAMEYGATRNRWMAAVSRYFGLICHFAKLEQKSHFFPAEPSPVAAAPVATK